MNPLSSEMMPGQCICVIFLIPIVDKISKYRDSDSYLFKICYYFIFKYHQLF